MKKLGTAVIAVVALITAIAVAAPSNGGFEKDSFEGWKRLNDGGGQWQTYKGKFEPAIRRAGTGGETPSLPKPPEGKYAAALSQSDPGLNILHRVLRAKKRKELSLKLAYRNVSDQFISPDTLDPMAEENQQVRVDLLKPKAPLDTLKNSDIIDTLLRTKPGDPLFRPYGKLEAKVKGKFRLRIAEVDNAGQLLVGVDDLKLK